MADEVNEMAVELVDDGLLYFNGVNGTTGEYLVPPMSLEELTAVVKSRVTSRDKEEATRRRLQHKIEDTKTKPHLGWSARVDKQQPASSGWGVIFHRDEDEAVKQALQPLLEHRRAQLGAAKVQDKLKPYEPHDTVGLWLSRHGVSHGNPDPQKVPYYLLLVGSPAQIPYQFGYLLDAEYAVGRLHFNTPEEYGRYAQAVIEYEQGAPVTQAKEIVFFAPRHDDATLLSAELLVKPLANGRPAQGALAVKPPVTDDTGFRARKIVGQAATKAALKELLCPSDAAQPPAFLFTASHGLGWDLGDARQATATGALLCQGWAGPGEISTDCYFAAADLPAAAQLRGLITFHFACFGAGTPAHTRFPDRNNPQRKPQDVPKQIAAQPFFAPLPQALLTHGALACIGHVDKAWNWSFQIPGRLSPQINTFDNALFHMLKGETVGFAMEDFNERCLVLTKNLYPDLESFVFSNQALQENFAKEWTQMTDAESYLILGDPAIRLRVKDLQ